MKIQPYLSITILLFITVPLFSQYKERAEELISTIADDYNPPSMNIGDPEKYYWPKTIARFEKYGINDELANSYIDTFRLNSPFHFTLVGMVRIMSKYPDAPSMKKYKIQYLKEVFERQDSHNPWTAEGTENHISMSRTSGYLFAQHAMEYPQQFPQAHLRLQQMELWIKHWAKQLYEHGNAEWNSDIYEVYNMIGWLNLYDFAKDENIKKVARAVLDFYAAEVALHYSWGLAGGSSMRGSGAGLSRYNATNYLGWLWFGSTSGFPFGFSGSQYIQMVHPVTSNYSPPAAIVALGKKNIKKPSYFYMGRPSYSIGKPSMVKQLFYITDEYTLGSALSPYGGWTGSTWQMISWRLVVKSKKEGVPYEIGGNGRFYDVWSGKTTNPFTQVVQHKNVIVQMTKMPENVQEIVASVKTIVDEWAEDWERDFRKRFPHDEHKAERGVVNFGGKLIKENASYITLPADAKITEKDSSYLVDLHDVLLSVVPFQGLQPVKEVTLKNQQRKILLDAAPTGTMCGFVIEVLQQNEFTSAQEKKLESINKNVQTDEGVGMVSYLSVLGDSINTIYQSSGTFQEATVDWGYGVDAPKIMLTYPDFHQPEWPSGEGYGRLPYAEINNNVLDFSEYWPLFQGDEVNLVNKKLTIDAGGHLYNVNYQGKIPEFE